jgi:flagellar biosynthesis protein
MKSPRDLKAVAVEYGNKAAPSVVAKASGLEAQQMIDHALDAEKPVIHDPGLIEAMDGLELNEEIPEELYFSVAVVLSWVFWLRGETPK